MVRKIYSKEEALKLLSKKYGAKEVNVSFENGFGIRFDGITIVRVLIDDEELMEYYTWFKEVNLDGITDEGVDFGWLYDTDVMSWNAVQILDNYRDFITSDNNDDCGCLAYDDKVITLFNKSKSVIKKFIKNDWVAQVQEDEYLVKFISKDGIEVFVTCNIE